MKLSRTGAYGLVISAGKVLLLEKQKGPYKGLLDLPGGGIEPGESPYDALVREFGEEIAVRFAEAKLLGSAYHCFKVNNLEFHHRGVLFEVQGLEPLIGPPEEPIGWYALKDLSLESLTPFAKKAITRSLDLFRNSISG